MPLSSHPRGQHMTPAQFQAEHRAAKKARLERETANKRSTVTRDQDISAEINAIIDADAPVPALSHRQEDTWPHCPPDSARPRYTVEDFEIAYASHEQTKQWYRQFPALGKRNFFLVQRHFATAKHYDLRIQLDGGTVSWAIPRFSELATLPVDQLGTGSGGETNILAVETNPHPIRYTLFEARGGGGGLGVTAVYDVGTYKIVPSQRTIRTGKDIEGDTDDEGQPADERHEDAFAEGYYKATFRDVPSRWGKVAKSSPPDKGEHRAFIIELNGERWQGLRLRFHRPARMRHRVGRSDPDGLVQLPDKDVRDWFVCLDSRPDARGVLNPALSPERSLLTGRTMDEILRGSREVRRVIGDLEDFDEDDDSQLLEGGSKWQQDQSASRSGVAGSGAPGPRK